MAIDPGNFCWFECATKDPEKAKAFYEDVFGWTLEDSPMPGEHEGVYTLIQIDGEDIAGLYELTGPMFEGVPPHWMSYVAVENADETTERAKTLGAEVMMGPMDVPGVGRISILQDPLGASISIFQAGEHEGMSSKSNLGWCELHTTDTERSKAFYSELFSWKPKDDPSGMYTEWQVGGRSIGGMMPIPAERQGMVPPNWVPYAMVDDCDATLAKVEQAGGKVVHAATDIEKVGRFAIIQDPSGAMLAVIKLTHHL